MNWLVLASSFALQSPGAAIDADQFVRLVQTLHGGVRDVSLIVEGTSEFVAPQETRAKVRPVPNARYQSAFSLRDA